MMAVVLGGFNYGGGKLTGFTKDPTIDEVGRKEYLRRNRRRPFEETIEELGEGRGMFCRRSSPDRASLTATGIYGPGYAERRAQRLKDRYGFEVPPPVSASP